jgi:membrane protease YdiL (CAAX protease family)
MPWVIVAVLFCLWARGIYDSHVESAEFFPPNALETSLTYLDHTLRLEDASASQPEWIRTVLEDAGREDTLGEARDTLELLEDDEDFHKADPSRALAVIRAELDTEEEDLTKLDVLTQSVLEHRRVPEESIQPLAEKIAAGNARWWDTQLARRLLANQPNAALSKTLETQQARDHQLFLRTAISTCAVWLLSIAGLVFLPHAFREIKRGWFLAKLRGPVRYSSRWEPSLVITLLLAGDLLADYLVHQSYLATEDNSGFIFNVAVDTAWRLLAPALALVVLFRKPRHAIRSLGLNTKPDWRLILAGFAALWWFNTGFGYLAGQWSEPDPTGGLDLMENGWPGLIYGLLSACLIAPIAEETFYRGLLLRGMERRFGFWLSAIVVSIAFALAHYYDVFGLISVGVLGFTMAVIYRSTRSLTTIIGLHALYNFAITMPAWLLYHAKF